MSAAPMPRELQSSDDRLSKRNFDRLARFIFEYSGIKMPPSKATMLEGRLRRRLRATGQSSFDLYCDYLFDGDGLETETVHLIDAVTTNKTDFFREPKHFEYMQETAIPDLLRRGISRIRAWSAACSTGAEPYTIAMVLDHALTSVRQASYSIIATDLSTDVLATARAGIYPAELLHPTPAPLRAKYVMNPVRPGAGKVRIVPDLRARVGFARLNLMDDRYPIGEPVHLLFCRNVLIYFDKQTQIRVLSRLCANLAPGGYLFIGHSESVVGLELPIQQVANTIFKKG